MLIRTTNLGAVPGSYKERGERLRDLRDRRAWSQEHVARRLGVSSKTVWNWEAGAGIRPEHRRAVAELYGISIEELEGMAESPDPFKLADYINESLEEFRDAFEAVRERMIEQDRERAAIAKAIRAIENAVHRQGAILERIELMVARPGASELAEALEAPRAEPGRPAPGKASPSRSRRASA